MQQLQQYLSSYFHLDDSSLDSMSAMFEEIHLDKNDFFVRRDQYAQHLGFLHHGFVRIFAMDVKAEKEITQWISMPGSFVTELSSFLFDTPSRFNLQALTDCTLYVISKTKYRQMGRDIPAWPELEKMFLAKCFITLENRVFSQLSMTAEDKVRSLMDLNSELFLQVPLQYIASMLGMTPETLSRVRKKMIS